MSLARWSSLIVGAPSMLRLMPISLLGVFSFLGFANAASQHANASRTARNTVEIVLIWMCIRIKQPPRTIIY